MFGIEMTNLLKFITVRVGHEILGGEKVFNVISVISVTI